MARGKIIDLAQSADCWSHENEADHKASARGRFSASRHGDVTLAGHVRGRTESWHRGTEKQSETGGKATSTSKKGGGGGDGHCGEECIRISEGELNWLYCQCQHVNASPRDSSCTVGPIGSKLYSNTVSQVKVWSQSGLKCPVLKSENLKTGRSESTQSVLASMSIKKRTEAFLDKSRLWRSITKVTVCVGGVLHLSLLDSQHSFGNQEQLLASVWRAVTKGNEKISACLSD